MQLRSFSYAEKQGTPESWRTEPLTFGPINLLVGKNTTGKTRILNALRRAAECLAGRGDIAEDPAEWNLELANEHSLSCAFAMAGGKVLREKLSRRDALLLVRAEDGTGRIQAEKLQQELDFQSPPEILATVGKRDLVQHGFLEPLHQWASSVRYFPFGSAGGGAGLLDRFQQGIAGGGADFVERLRGDLEQLGHEIEAMHVAHSPRGRGEPLLLVKERRLRAPTPAQSLSHGLRRCLALALFINDVPAEQKSGCVLIDDLGEGLDFAHACSTAEWLLERTRRAGVQLIFSTNDRFIMNKVPLENWSILEQEDDMTRVINYFNSRQRFDDFRFTGLSNFDFFSMDFDDQEESPA